MYLVSTPLESALASVMAPLMVSLYGALGMGFWFSSSNWILIQTLPPEEHSHGELVLSRMANSPSQGSARSGPGFGGAGPALCRRRRR